MKLSEVNNNNTSHIPVLQGIPSILEVKRVLELGYGHLSTPIFLRYPDLEQLDSYENNPDYARQVGISDPKLNLHVVAGDIANNVKEIDLLNYDLVFIDDSSTLQERTNTIRTITLKNNNPDILFIIHDVEHSEYRNAINPYLKTFFIDTKLPHTGLAWSEQSINWNLDKCNQLMDLIR